MFDQFENNYEMAKQADGRFVELQRRKIQVIEVAYLNFFIGHVRACKEKNQILIWTLLIVTFSEVSGTSERIVLKSCNQAWNVRHIQLIRILIMSLGIVLRFRKY